MNEWMNENGWLIQEESQSIQQQSRVKISELKSLRSSYSPESRDKSPNNIKYIFNLREPLFASNHNDDEHDDDDDNDDVCPREDFWLLFLP